jgi:hypothetical protein
MGFNSGLKGLKPVNSNPQDPNNILLMHIHLSHAYETLYILFISKY